MVSKYEKADDDLDLLFSPNSPLDLRVSTTTAQCHQFDKHSAMSNHTSINCESLASRTSFSSYVASIRNASANNFTLVNQCKAEICNALWGSGNPDISGVGVRKWSSCVERIAADKNMKMIVGYIIENVVGLILVSLLYILIIRMNNRRKGAPRQLLDRCVSILRRGCSSFYDCAVFFTFSIQLACIVVLARLDSGISASGMGDSTAKITWAVSLLTILPLMHVAFNPGLLREPQPDHAGTRKEQKRRDRKEQLRFLQFALCWLLFIYPFLSRMMETFGPSAIGGKSQVISTDEWDVIATACTAGVDAPSNQEILAMDFFSVAGSVFVCLLALTKIIWLAVQRHHKDSRLVRQVRGLWSQHSRRLSRLSIALFVTVPLIAVSQLWTVFRLRRYQQQIARTAGNEDADGQWTFGQIVAVTIFVPVGVECCFAWLYD